MSRPNSETRANLTAAPVFRSNFSIRSLLSDTSELFAEHQPAAELTNESASPPTTEELSVDNTRSRYSRSPQARPPYTYSALIVMAIRNSPKNRLTLSEICDWIADKFAYYRYKEKLWQNSIRHNLSLSKYFVKVNRGLDDRGRGHYWTLAPSAAALTIGETTGRLRRIEHTFNNPSLAAGALRSRPSFHFATHYGHHPYIQSMPTGMPYTNYYTPNAAYFPSPQAVMIVPRMAPIQNQGAPSTHRIMQEMQRFDYPPAPYMPQ